MHQGSLGCKKHLFVAFMLVFVAVVANAGEMLRLKSGNIRVDRNAEALAISTSGLSTTGEFVVQFEKAITPADRRHIKEAGLRVLSYLPDDAYVVYGSQKSINRLLKANRSVRAVVEFKSDWKVSSEFTPLSVFTQDSRVRTHIRLSDAAFAESVLSAIEGIKDLEVKLTGEKVIVADVPYAEVTRLAAVPGIEWLEPVPQIELMYFDANVETVGQLRAVHAARAQATGYESGTKLMGFDAAWSRGFTGAGQTVAMADTGLDSGDLKSLHKDLSGTTKAYSVTFLPFTWADSNGHGTHVAGSVVGNGSNSSGGIRGGAYNASFIGQAIMVPFLGILDPTALQDPNKTVGVAAGEGAFVHTNSWGADSKGAYDAMAAAYDEYMWKNPDILVVFAAGNSGVDGNSDGRIDEGSVGSPGTAKNVLTVGASENYILTGGIQQPAHVLKGGEGAKSWPVEPLYSDKLSDNPNGLAIFSSRGPTQDGRLKPEVVAPGTNIVSTRSSAIEQGGVLWGEYDQNYLFCGGTSMATPLVAGAATVAREFLQKAVNISKPSAALIKASLMHTAFDLYPGQFGTGPKQELPNPRPNIHEGFGRVDMDALTSLSAKSIVADERVGVGVNEEKVYRINARRGLIATLSYTDAPGAANAAKTLVNDIDLVVITPSGQTLSLNDRTNNSEMIEAKSGGTGEYTVIVKGVNVPSGNNGKQPFALLVSSVE